MKIKGFDPKYDDNKEKDNVYIGKLLHSKSELGTAHRIAELIIDSNNILSESAETQPIKNNYKIEESVILYETGKGEQKYFCWLLKGYENNNISALHISRRKGKKCYGDQEIVLNAEAVHKLKQFLNQIHTVDMERTDRYRVKLSNQSYDNLMSDEEFKELLLKNQSSIDIYYKLVGIKKMELAINRLEKILQGNYKNEVDIQEFLKENIWMFGNEYTFIIEKGKINSKNILDIMPKNIESFVDIIEVKLPKEKLFNFDDNHKNYYPQSNLTKAIAQTQNYIFELEKMTNNIEYQNKNECRIIKPKGIIIFGSEIELCEGEVEYLRILNASYHNLQIITYQQLLARAKNIYSLNTKNTVN